MFDEISVFALTFRVIRYPSFPENRMGNQNVSLVVKQKDGRMCSLSEILELGLGPRKPARGMNLGVTRSRAFRFLLDKMNTGIEKKMNSPKTEYTQVLRI